MRLVVIESPYSGDIERHIGYARLALLDSILRGECPIASHLLYPQILDDTEPSQRTLGMNLGFEWYRRVDLIAFYIDLGMSRGMLQARRHIIRHHLPHELRSINDANNPVLGLQSSSTLTE